MTDRVRLATVIIDGELFGARFEVESAPNSVASVLPLLPYSERIIHVRWSGEACWIPLGNYAFGVGCENPTSYTAPGQMLLYPGGLSETEILLAYGPTRFASKAGQLAGNHFLTITEGLDRLARLGRETLQTGAKSIRIEAGKQIAH